MVTASLIRQSDSIVKDSPNKDQTEGSRHLSPGAERALKEADERRRQRDAQATSRPPESGGQKGPEPTRYGDWEKGGIVSDF
ncbi:MAG: DUF1674 domain-containing protein [Rhodospirillales bacterium]|nr:DUF1674 domain-containing protein [Rhodospirillales bacterium]